MNITMAIPNRARRGIFVLGLGLAGLALAACGDDDEAPSAAEADSEEDGGAPAGGAVAYEVTEIAYSDVTAPAGGVIEITNTSGAPHTFTANEDGFDVEVESDATATVDVPSEAGEYVFHCEIHPSMEATLTVQ